MHDEFSEPQDRGGELAWRETYVVLFSSAARPTLTQLEGAVADAGRRLRVENLRADDDGLFRSVLVQAPEDNAALDIRYESGAAITERAMTLAEQLRDELDQDQMQRLLSSDAWLEVMHFERLAAADGEEEAEEDPFSAEGLDPATLITVVEALADLTGGLPIDPTAGEVLI